MGVHTETGAEVRVRLRYHSTIREKTGRPEERVAFPAGSGLSAVSEWLGVRYGLSVPGPALLAAVNGSVWNRLTPGASSPLREGDEISLFPLLMGG